MKELLEKSRNELITQSKYGQRERDGKTRYEKRLKSRFVSSNRSYNKLDMNKLFKDDILNIIIEVEGETDNYEVKISYGGFLKELQKILNNSNKDEIELKDIVKALIAGFNNNDIYIHCSCLHPDTHIKLLDGTIPTVKEMKERFDKGEKLYVYSVDSNGDFKPGEVEKVWITKTTNEFIRVTLDNGKQIMTTPDHLFMNKDGWYLEAQELDNNEILKSSNIDLNPKIIKVERIKIADTPVYDIKVKDFHNFVVDGGVILHNCPDFCFRFDYWATVKNFNSGEPQLIAADETNPKNELGCACKHVLLVLSNTSWLIKVASVIRNYINYMKKYRERQYADIIYPAIYGKKYEEPVQLSIEDSDELETNSQDIDKSNIYARTKTQFKPGNKQGLRFASRNETDNQEEMDFK